jgi:hypothetical protein
MLGPTIKIRMNWKVLFKTERTVLSKYNRQGKGKLNHSTVTTIQDSKGYRDHNITNITQS